MIELGDKVECKVTGVTGIVTSIAKCLTGCDRATVQPPVNKDGKMPEAYWIDVHALAVLKKNVIKAESVQGPNKPGGPPTKAIRY